MLTIAGSRIGSAGASLSHTQFTAMDRLFFNLILVLGLTAAAEPELRFGGHLFTRRVAEPLA